METVTERITTEDDEGTVNERLTTGGEGPEGQPDTVHERLSGAESVPEEAVEAPAEEKPAKRTRKS